MRTEEDIVRTIAYIPAHGRLGDRPERRTLGEILTPEISGVRIPMKVVRIELFHYEYGPEIKIHVEIEGFQHERALDSIYPLAIHEQRYDPLYPDGDEIIEAFRK